MKELFHKKPEKPKSESLSINKHDRFGTPLSNIEEGIIVLESEPHMRTMCVVRNSGNIFRIPLPRMIFIVRYFLDSKGKFLWPGIYGKGLHVYATREPVTSLSSDVYLMPTDVDRHGLICSDHAFDNIRYNKLELLIDTAIGGWFRLPHCLSQEGQFRSYLTNSFFIDDWTKLKSVTEFESNVKWQKAVTLKDALITAEKKWVYGSGTYGNSLGWPENVRFSQPDIPKPVKPKRVSAGSKNGTN